MVNISKRERREIIKYILNTLLKLGAIYIACQSPYFVNKIINEFFRNPKWPIDKLKKYFRELKYQKYVLIEKENGRIKIELTPKGRKRMQNFNFWDLKIKKGRWDKKWRIIIFDIPKKLNKIREILRLKLRDLKFYKFQKSVWLTPYQCEKEIAFIREFLGIKKYLKVIIAQDVELDNEILKFFHLKPRSRKINV